MDKVYFVCGDPQWSLVNETRFHWCHDESLLVIGVGKRFLNNLRQRSNQTTRAYEKKFLLTIIQNNGPCQTIPEDLPLSYITHNKDFVVKNWDIMPLKHILCIKV